jgi:predicted Zn finger-like uncharacterized protein
MNISCPDCYAVYEVDLPDLEETGEIDVKCVKCQCVFTVHGEPAFSSMEEGGAGEEPPSIGSPVLQEESELTPPQNSPHDDELDDFLDNLIEREISDATNEPFSEDYQDDQWVENPDDPSDQKIDQKDDSNVGEFSTTSDINESKPNSFEKDEESNWAKAFEEGANQETDDEASTDSELKIDENPSDNTEDLWSKAFSEEELGRAVHIDKETSSEDDQNVYAGIDLEPNKEHGLASDAYSLDYDNEDENFDEFDLRPKKKTGLFSLPEGKTGSLVLAGIFVGILLIGGSAYFAFQTFAPDGLAEMKKPDAPIPEGLTPKNNSNENIFSTDDESVEPTSSKEVNKPVQEVKTGIAAELAKSKVLEKSEGVSQIDNNRVDKSSFAALNPSETQVTISAILPVAYDANDIKILSFTLELDLSNQNAAQRMRETLTVYENILVAGVEGLTSDQFFNDIIYVKEKLRKKFISDFNESLQGGRVSKARFREFLIQ